MIESASTAVTIDSLSYQVVEESQHLQSPSVNHWIKYGPSQEPDCIKPLMYEAHADRSAPE